MGGAHPEYAAVGEMAEARIGPVLVFFGDGEIGVEGADGFVAVEFFGGAHY